MSADQKRKKKNAALKAWRAKNKGHVSAYMKAWRAKKKGKTTKAKGKKRSSRKKAA